MEDARQLNFVTVHSRIRCHTTSVKLNAKLRLKNVRVVPCAINQPAGYENAQFYVLPALRGTASAFLLLKNDEDADEMRVVMKIENLDVLFGVDLSSEFVCGRPTVRSGMGSMRPYYKRKNNKNSSP